MVRKETGLEREQRLMEEKRLEYTNAAFRIQLDREKRKLTRGRWF